MDKTTNILFITWDADNTHYLETLFIPIFSKIQENTAYRFFCLQYTWADAESIQKRQLQAENAGLQYRGIPMKNKLSSKIKCLFQSKKDIQAFCHQFNIHYLMPRSIWPAFICLRSQSQLPIIYEADGLALLEKKEYTSSPISNFIIQQVEQKIIAKSQLVFTRAQYAVDWYQQHYNLKNPPPFQVVYNGVSEEQFYFDEALRQNTRQNLGIKEDEDVFLYVGSLGKKYGIDQAIEVFQQYHRLFPNSKFIILSGHTQKAEQAILKDKTNAIILKQVPHQEINAYLNAADFGFCFIRPSEAIKAVNPIKLNEYLMAGLPALIYSGIGDTEKFLYRHENAFFVEDKKANEILLQNIHALKNQSRKRISEKAQAFCSLKMTSNTYISALNQHLS